MTRIDKLLDDLRKSARRRGFSQRGLARKAGLHSNTLLHFYDTVAFSPSIQTIRILEGVLLPMPRGPVRGWKKARDAAEYEESREELKAYMEANLEEGGTGEEG